MIFREKKHNFHKIKIFLIIILFCITIFSGNFQYGNYINLVENNDTKTFSDTTISNEIIRDKEIKNSFNFKLTDSWKYSSLISISPKTPMSDFQIKIELNSSDFDYSKANIDGSDIRFTLNNGTFLNYWIQQWNSTGNSIVWVNIPDSGTSTIIMLFGNAIALSESNGNATFIFFEDFNNPLDSSVWTNETDTYSTITLGNGLVNLSTNSPNDWNSGGNYYPVSHFGFADGRIKHGQTFPWLGTGGVAIDGIAQFVTSNITGAAATNDKLYENGKWENLEIKWVNDTYAEAFNSSNSLVRTTYIPTTPYEVNLASKTIYAGPGTGWGAYLYTNVDIGKAGRSMVIKIRDLGILGDFGLLQVDWIIVRNINGTDPIISFSSLPKINGPNDFTIKYGDSGYIILWTISESNPTNYTVFSNGSVFSIGNYTDSVFVSLNGLIAGYYNFTLIVTNNLGLTSKDEVWINVIPSIPDTSPPIISSPNDIILENGSLGYKIIWNSFDDHPWSVMVTRNNSTLLDTPWVGNDIEISLDNLDVGIYEFNCSLTDEKGNSVWDLVVVTIIPVQPDNSPPTINPLSPVTIEVGTTGNNLSWICFDTHPFVYRITVNEIEVIFSPWHGENITYNLDYLEVGNWKINLTVWDLVGNNITSSVEVTVIPLLDFVTPTASSPADIYVTENMTGRIVWEVNDEHPGVYSIYKNGSLIIDKQPWFNGIIEYKFSLLSLGTWEFNLTIWDIGGNSVWSIAIVNVISGSEFDTSPPLIASIPNQNIIFGTSGNFIVFYLFDENPSRYAVLVNESLIAENEWIFPNIKVKMSLDNLSVGIFAVKFIAWDIFEKNSSITIKVTVSGGDTDPPTISSPPDIKIEKGEGASIKWNVSDRNPSTYEIILLSSGEIVSSGNWSTKTINYDYKGILNGSFTYRCIVYDLYGNMAQDDVTIYVNTEAAASDGFEIVTMLSIVGIIVLRKQKINKRGLSND